MDLSSRKDVASYLINLIQVKADVRSDVVLAR